MRNAARAITVPADLRVDWRRLGRRTLIGALLALTVVVLYKRTLGPQFGFDFYGGAWKAGQAILHGRSPYPHPDPALLFAVGNEFVTPPLLGVLAVPFSLLPFKLAAALWALFDAGAFIAALRLLGLRDIRLYTLAVCSYAFVDSIVLGQSDGLLVLSAAAAWRWRDSWPGGVAAGVLIAAKLLAWPLLIWLLVTRRVRSAALAAATTIGVTAATWAMIDFQGLTTYPQLLAADARAFEGWVYSNSAVGEAMHFGASAGLATAIGLAFAVSVAAAMIWLGRGSDAAWFGAALVLGLTASPILWPHYLLLLFVPLAICSPRTLGPWALTAVLWIALFTVSAELRTSAILATVALVSLALARRSRKAPQPDRGVQKLSRRVLNLATSS